MENENLELECEICGAEMTQDEHEFCDICEDCRDEMGF